MSYKETANDLYEAGVQDDEFLLMAKSNEKCKVVISSISQTKSTRKMDAKGVYASI